MKERILEILKSSRAKSDAEIAELIEQEIQRPDDKLPDGRKPGEPWASGACEASFWIDMDSGVRDGFLSWPLKHPNSRNRFPTREAAERFLARINALRELEQLQADFGGPGMWEPFPCGNTWTPEHRHGDYTMRPGFKTRELCQRAIGIMKDRLDNLLYEVKE